METMNCNELLGSFSNVVGIIFNNWTALKLAVEHGMGGSAEESTRKLNAMLDTVCHSFLSGCSEWTTLSDILADLMDSEFSTILEDDSSDEIAMHLVDLYKMFSAGDQQALMLACNSLPNKFPIHLKPPVQKMSSSSETLLAGENEVEEQKNMILEDDGWTVVKKR